MAAGRLQHAKGAVDVGAEIGFRLLDRGHDVGAGRKMEHPLDAGGGRGHGGGIGDIAFDDRELRIPVMMLEVSAPADDKRVERAHRAALRQQAVDEVAADKTGPARHQVYSCRRCHHPSSVGRELMRSKATNFKHRWSAAKSRVPQGFCGVFSGSCRRPAGAAGDCNDRHHDPFGAVAVPGAANWRSPPDPTPPVEPQASPWPAVAKPAAPIRQ